MSAPDPRFLIAIPPREPMDGALIAASALACRRALAASIAAALVLGGLRLASGGALGPIGRKTAATQNPHAECLAKLESSP